MPSLTLRMPNGLSGEGLRKVDFLPVQAEGLQLVTTTERVRS